MPHPARQIGPALGLDGLDRTAAARTLDQAKDRQAQFVGHFFGIDGLFLDRRIGRAAANGEVVAADNHRAAINPAPPHDAVGGRMGGDIAIPVVFVGSGGGADFPKCAVIEDLVDPLPHGQPAALVLTLYLVFAAQLFRQCVTFE